MTLRHRLIFFAILGVAAFLSLFCFTVTPASWFDEGIYLQLVTNVAERGIWGIQTAPGVFEDAALISIGYPLVYAGALMFKIFGAGIVTLRATAILFLLGFLIMLFFLARRLYGVLPALGTVGALAVFSPLYGNGKVFLGEVPGLFFFVVGLLLLARLEDDGWRGSRLAVVSGVLLGFAASTKPTYLIILPALALAAFIRCRLFKESAARRAFAWVFLGLLFALSLWAFTQFGGATSFARVFAHYENPYYVANFFPVVAGNVRRFVTEATPMHFLALFVLALWFTLARARSSARVAVAEYTALVFVFAILAFYVRTAGWYRYFFPAHALLFLFFGAGLMALIAWVRFIPEAYRGHVFLLVVGAFSVVELLPLKQEFFMCKVDPATDLAPVLRQIPSGASVFFYHLPEVAARFPGNNFSAYLRMSDSFSYGGANLALLRSGAFDMVVVDDHEEQFIAELPPCYVLERDWRLISFYRKDPARSCVP